MSEYQWIACETVYINTCAFLGIICLLNCSSSHGYDIKIIVFNVCKKVRLLNLTKINRKMFRLKGSTLLVKIIANERGWIRYKLRGPVVRKGPGAYVANIFVFLGSIKRNWGTRWCGWLRICATRRKVAGSIPDDMVEIFHWINSSTSTMDQGSTQPLTEIITRNFSGGGGGWLRCPACSADTLTTFICHCLKIWRP